MQFVILNVKYRWLSRSLFIDLYLEPQFYSSQSFPFPSAFEKPGCYYTDTGEHDPGDHHEGPYQL